MPRLYMLAFVVGAAIVACAGAPPRSGAPVPALPPSLELAVFPPDSTTDVDVRLSSLVRAQVDTIITETRATHTEQAWCVVSYQLLLERERAIITLETLERSPNVARADSVGIWGSGRLCDDDYAPGLHSHVVWAHGWLYFPTPRDYESAFDRAAPFHLLVSAGDGRTPRLTVYALRGRALLPAAPAIDATSRAPPYVPP